MNKESNSKSHPKVQRLAALRTTGVKKYTSQVALEAIISLPPLTWYVQEVSVETALRLRESG